jgi:hypothetical protein
VKDNLFSDTIRGKTFSTGNLRHREEFVKVIKINFVCHGNICPVFEEPHEYGLCGESEKKNTTVLLPIYNM